MAVIDYVSTSSLLDAPCKGCPNETKCATGFVCWNYVDFQTYGIIQDDDRRMSRQLFLAVIQNNKKTVNKYLRRQINDYKTQ